MEGFCGLGYKIYFVVLSGICVNSKQKNLSEIGKG